MMAAAIWAVAVGEMAARIGSRSAKELGLAMLAMAQLEIAAAAVPSWKISSSTRTVIMPIANVVITPCTIPNRPPVTSRRLDLDDPWLQQEYCISCELLQIESEKQS